MKYTHLLHEEWRRYWQKKKNGGKTRRKMNFQFEDQIGCTEDI